MTRTCSSAVRSIDYISGSSRVLAVTRYLPCDDDQAGQEQEQPQELEY